jgi:transglutaminase-like putative cysteine protease
MSEKRFNFDLLFRLLAVAGMSISLAIPLISGFGYQGPGFWISLLFTLLVTAFYYVLQSNPVLGGIFPLAFAGLCLAYFRDPLYFTAKALALFSLRQPADSLFWPLIIIALTVLCIYIILFKIARSLPILLGLGLLTTAALWYRYVDSAYPAIISYSLFWLMLRSYKNGFYKWTAATGPDQESCSTSELRNNWLSYTALVLLIALLGTLILPKNVAPLPWPALQHWTAEHFSILQNLRPAETPLTRGDGGEFTLDAFGLQAEEELGGPLYLDDLILLKVSGRGRTYLRGTVMDSYSGRSWTDKTAYKELEELPRPPEALVDYLTENTLTIRHLRLRTSTLFSGLYPQEVTAPPGSVLANGGYALKFERSVPLNYEYRINSYSLAYRPDFEQLEKEENLALLSPYLELPPELPLRVIRLALEITAAEESAYGRIKALESYLRQHYRYVAETPFTPDGRDFVDYFLFDLREGYCTYFASALAVLGRAAGVPTRFVSGFVVPAAPAEKDLFYIAGTDAHAWIEAYIPGIGWLPYEATPGFVNDSALPGRISDSDLSYFSGSDSVNGGPANRRAERDLNPDNPAGAPENLNYHEMAMLIRRLMLAFIASGLIILIALIIIILFRLRKIKLKLERINSFSERSKTIGYYNLILIFLERLSLGKRLGETPQEYSWRIRREVHLWHPDFRDLSAGVSLALYSKEPLPPRLAEETELFFQIIFDRYLEEVGRIKAGIEILVRGWYFNRSSFDNQAEDRVILHSEAKLKGSS